MADYSFPIEPSEHIGLAWRFAGRFAKQFGGSPEDHVGAAMEGIICASRSFDPEKTTERNGVSGYSGLRKVRFSTYATRSAWNHMKRQYFIARGEGHNGDRMKIDAKPIIEGADRAARTERRKVNRSRLMAVMNMLTTEKQRTAMLACATAPMNHNRRGGHKRSVCETSCNATISLHIRNLARTLAAAGITREWFYED